MRFRDQKIAQKRGELKFIEFAALAFEPKYRSVSTKLNFKTFPKANLYPHLQKTDAFYTLCGLFISLSSPC
jgi:hypothetical protein